MKEQHSIPAKKWCFAAVLALFLLLPCLVPAHAAYMPWPDSGTCGPDASYKIEDGILTVSGTGPVTHAMDLFNSPVYTVVIEDGITALEAAGTFTPYVSHRGGAVMEIRDVAIPDSVQFIAEGCFRNSPWLESQTEEFFIVGDHILLDYNGGGGDVVIPDAVRSIAGKAFYENGNVTSVTVGGNVEEIGASAFYGCTELKKAVIGDSVKTVGTFAFYSCPKLEEVEISDSVTSIGQRAFGGTPWLEDQTDEFFIVGDGILLDYNGPGGAVVLPESVRAIPSYTFAHLYSWEDTSRRVTEITIPATVTDIQPYAIDAWASGLTVVIHGEIGSAAEEFAVSYDFYRFMPFGQEDGSLYNFINHNIFSEYSFSDVKEGDWFYDDVATTYNVMLMKGKSLSEFDSSGNIKLSEAVTVAVRVRDTYYYEQSDFSTNGIWYQPYVDYALEHGIIAEVPDDWERPATRAEFASMLAAALPERELEAIHSEVGFTDIDEAHPAYDAVMLLARAGVMQGKGEGRFDPDTQVKRCEAAAMLARCVRPNQRLDLT